MSKQTTYLYYKGEKSNPFEEVNDTQGAWCERYNEVASMLWFFEYHWAKGWNGYKELTPRNQSYYFELYKEPQKTFKSIEEALLAFSMHAYSGILHYGCQRWVTYIYEHGMAERFYKPVFNVVPVSEIPRYLHWYKGESKNPYELLQHKGDVRSFWWSFEQGWYSSTDEPTQNGWEKHLHSWFVNRVWAKGEPLPKKQLNEYYRAYEAGEPPKHL